MRSPRESFELNGDIEFAPAVRTQPAPMHLIYKSTPIFTNTTGVTTIGSPPPW